WIATCPVSVRRARARHARAGRCGGAGLPEPDDHHDRAVRGRRTDRRPGAHPRRDDAGADRPEHRRGGQAGRIRHRRPRLRGVGAAPDGYALFANSMPDVQNLHFLPVPYNAIDDFAMIGMIVEGPALVLIVDAGLPYRSLAELVADAKANPRKLSFGTSGPAT